MNADHKLLHKIQDFINTNFNDSNILFNQNAFWDIPEYQMFLGQYIKKIMSNRRSENDNKCISKWCAYNSAPECDLMSLFNVIKLKHHQFDFINEVQTCIVSRSKKLMIYNFEQCMTLTDELKIGINKQGVGGNNYNLMSIRHVCTPIDNRILVNLAVQYNKGELITVLKKHKPSFNLIGELKRIFNSTSDYQKRKNSLNFALIELNVPATKINGAIAAFEVLSPKLKLHDLLNIYMPNELSASFVNVDMSSFI